ncbi:type I 3-dehydroquinate dehydratase [Staphylococcus capitis]|uniref:type I 3-dehydroquinate dehydratase n=2 Tax=Staphylococcus TaxID=1279 RepID=UPI00064A400A|nr:type I 3-dehydroquinate dehydratase [Staphylococcus capitis]AKL91322.1 3-dehydroquinate dehydratase [Staphylococcus capitis subsp. capitis]MCC0829146.1 type I 3-dehydroquinate dehydratase [Staphylococcus capitis]MCC3744710.1 type I 3-dehydroquinate dehydratase [Staphylococcus capitis]MCC9116773.1 type I 3-dehydroquinate dehydratase [Staphylococcus capitis]MCC9142905.1 type I 3-dehydroquinate dehydratase [Staphylococcus capitis]
MTQVDVAVTISPEETITQLCLDEIIKYKDYIDIVELRIDQWENFVIKNVDTVVQQLRGLNLDFKILVTYRTSSQGGKGNIEETTYIDIIRLLIEYAQFELLDIEWSGAINTDQYAQLITDAQEKNLNVVLSHHNFEETPSLEEIKFIYYKMQKLAPQYLKLAVMPNNKEDVLHLLEAMSVTSDNTPYKVIGISMSHLGLVSRVAQGVFGGSISYGCLGEPQAPGQIHVKALKQQLEFYQ